jgi:Universal stress protein family
VTFESAYEAESRDALERMRKLAPELENTPHHLHVRRGETWDLLSGIITQEHIDLLVLGTHARTGIEKLVMGSVAERLLRRASCPVLTVGPKVAGRLKEEFDETAKDIRPAEIDLKHIVPAVDFSPESLAAAPLAVSPAEEFD